MTDTPTVKTSEITKVPHEIRHARSLRRKAAVKPVVEERKRRKRESQGHLKKSIMKPASGHVSPRPNRHANKRKKLERYAELILHASEQLSEFHFKAMKSRETEI